MRWRDALVVVVGFALLIGQIPPKPMSPASSAGAGHRRVERTFRFPEKWEASCDLDRCVVTELFKVPVKSPQGLAEIDVTMSVTLDYQTGPERTDRGHLSAGYSLQPRGRSIQVVPRWPIAPAPSPAATTLLWQKRRLEAEGQRYFFTLAVASREGGGDDNQNFVTGRRVTVVIEMWPAGRR